MKGNRKWPQMDTNLHECRGAGTVGSTLVGSEWAWGSVGRANISLGLETGGGSWRFWRSRPEPGARCSRKPRLETVRRLQGRERPRWIFSCTRLTYFPRTNLPKSEREYSGRSSSTGTFLGFFIELPFGRRRLAGADDSNVVVYLRMRYDQQPSR